jgi:hypothetical protein
MKSAGEWTGSPQSLLYVFFDADMVVSVTQSGTEEMDVALTSTQNTSTRYDGTISSRFQTALVPDDGQL